LLEGWSQNPAYDYTLAAAQRCAGHRDSLRQPQQGRADLEA
jgi:hypothetical protein